MQSETIILTFVHLKFLYKKNKKNIKMRSWDIPERLHWTILETAFCRTDCIETVYKLQIGSVPHFLMCTLGAIRKFSYADKIIL